MGSRNARTVTASASGSSFQARTCAPPSTGWNSTRSGRAAARASLMATGNLRVLGTVEQQHRRRGRESRRPRRGSRARAHRPCWPRRAPCPKRPVVGRRPRHGGRNVAPPLPSSADSGSRARFQSIVTSPDTTTSNRPLARLTVTGSAMTIPSPYRFVERAPLGTPHRLAPQAPGHGPARIGRTAQRHAGSDMPSVRGGPAHRYHIGNLGYDRCRGDGSSLLEREDVAPELA